jgi:threo-3-hydroxy-L-aspartate ammonia-lyase
VVLELRDVEAAAERLRGIAAKTPVLTSRTLDARTGAHVFVKAECFQRGGAFKFRGAYNKISQVAESCRGIAAFSSGNHAQAVALASAAVGLPATILMPADAPEAKVEATRGYGAEVVTYDRYSEDRERLGQALAAEQGLELVPPYDDPLVMAGQGTVALELLEEVGAVDVLVVPVGGGGLAAGCATVVKALAPHARVVGVEPEAADDTRRSLERGERIEIPVPATIADGLQVSAPGRLTFEVNRRLVDEVVTVSDANLVEAMRFLFERMKVVAEPSGAAAVAALLASRVSVPGGRMAAVLSGGNVGARRFCELLVGGIGDIGGRHA